MINFDDFKKVELRVGKVIEAERVEKSEKLLRLVIDIGEEKRQILSGIAEFYEPQEMLGKNIVVVVNLESRSMMGFESQGMVLAAGADNRPILLTTEDDIEPGSLIT